MKKLIKITSIKNQMKKFHLAVQVQKKKEIIKINIIILNFRMMLLMMRAKKRAKK